jgi:hypothetical protein
MSHQFDRILDEYRRLAAEDTEILYNARAEALTRSYSPKFLISDSIRLWLNSVAAWCVPFDVGNVVVNLTGRNPETSVLGAVRNVPDPGGALAESDLRGYSSDVTIAANDVTAQFVSGNVTRLEVTVAIAADQAQDLYTGDIRIGASGPVYAQVALLVIP